ncbi:hypothetical protein SNOG_11676 [Parastagonospora nodorum SN15]|uniref:Uncharacterized protein n=1 Tax=Phaeosphaeria nodorum (strain SN15 / ATCC MYA-4574 / FGSC 10173) TaxID=321614 RepID=Q0U988_PHANO|nr:hypothetical protein SNOG_11676 [Parastagonospora nodorum SN15]EAT80720.1 hypothetical protein SNOG_11676 [Parastagonospora nodorum SN15]
MDNIILPYQLQMQKKPQDSCNDGNYEYMRL